MNHPPGAADKWAQKRLRHSHRHPPLLNVNQALEKRLTAGERVADSLALVIGSWKFMIVQSMILAVWISFNIAAWVRHWDPYPFILLNLALSFQAAYAAPIIMMSQNRLAVKDRLMAEQDYLVNTKTEEEVKAIMQPAAAVLAFGVEDAVIEPAMALNTLAWLFHGWQRPAATGTTTQRWPFHCSHTSRRSPACAP